MSSNESDRAFKLHHCFLKIIEYLKSLHYDESHWINLESFSDGRYFQTDLQCQSIRFLLSPNIEIEVKIHPSGKSFTNVDCYVQVASICAWYPNSDEPRVYKWEYGNPCKLKKEDKDWVLDIELLKALEKVLENVMQTYS